MESEDTESEPNQCPYCSTRLTQETLDETEGIRYVCEACGYPFND